MSRTITLGISAGLVVAATLTLHYVSPPVASQVQGAAAGPALTVPATPNTVIGGSGGIVQGPTHGGGPIIGPAPSPALPDPTGPKVKLSDAVDVQTFVWSGPSGIKGCPEIPASSSGYFKSQPVFEGARAPHELARHCTFTWNATTPDVAPDLEGLKLALSTYGYGNLPLPVPDHGVVEPLSEPDPRLVQALEEQLVQQTTPVPPGLPEKSRVRVAIIDTAAVQYSSAQADNYGHGRLMGRIVRRLACGRDDASCPVEIDNELALAYLRANRRDDVRGGYFGTRVDLARAIHRELLAWGIAASADGGSPPPLVINLSVGWDAMHGGSVATPGGPSLMVELALQRAACLGAAIIVAAGNTSGDSRSGFMLPALWQERKAPDQSRCDELTGLPSDLPGLLRPRARDSADARLLEAVAAVDLYDQALATARTEATTRLVAYGQAAIVSDPRTGFTEVMSGSSIAAAVLSAAVASVWSVAPDEPANMVLQHVYDQAVPVTSATESCHSAVCTPVRRVSVCEAARAAACAGPGCDAIDKCKTMPAGEGRSRVAALAFSAADYPALPSRAFGSESSRTPPGPGYGYAPWVGPQPGPQTCPYCFVKMLLGHGIFTLSPTLQRASSMELQLDNGTSYQVGRTSSTLPERFSLTGLDTRGARSARLVSVVGEGSEARVTETPLLAF